MLVFLARLRAARLKRCADTRVGPHHTPAAVCSIELETKLCEVFTITEKAPIPFTKYLLVESAN